LEQGVSLNFTLFVLFKHREVELYEKSLSSGMNSNLDEPIGVRGISGIYIVLDICNTSISLDTILEFTLPLIRLPNLVVVGFN
jgi:hypothetical protein